MRFFLVVFIFAWLLGIVLGVSTLGVTPSLMVAGAYLVYLTLKGFKYEYLAVIPILMLFGYGIGSVNIVNQNIATQCLSNEVTRGVITKVVRIEGERAQYVLNTPSGCLVLLTTPPWPLYGEGSTITVDGEVESVAKVQKTYPEYAQYLLSQGISGTMYLPDIQVQQAANTWRSTMVSVLRTQTGKVFQEPVSGLVLTMTLAQRGAVSDQVTDQFRRTGVSHVLAISGLHMSLLAGTLLGFLMLMPLSPWMRTSFVIIFLWMYVSLLGFPVSAVRAVWFWTIFLLGLRLGWLVSLPTVILVTVTLLVSFNPLIVQEVGFQLSISAVIGIGLILFLVKGLPHHHIIKSYRTFADLVLVSLGAALATAPIVVYHFGQLSLVSVLGNMVVVPLVPIFLLLVITALMFSFVTPVLSLLISFVVHLIWEWWNLLTRYIAVIPGGYIENLNISLYVVVGYYCFVYIVCSYVLKKQRRTWREVWQ